jgi:ABC-type branched-subunit amino acid transport system ATPase component
MKMGTKLSERRAKARCGAGDCDHVYLLESGTLALEGAGRALIDNPYVRQAYLGG